MKLETLRVHAPTSVVFLCGGAIDDKLEFPAVLRDAFLRIARREGVPYKIVLAEAAKPLTNDAGYDDLLSFESDIARVVGLILLFVESPGSLAELGAFAALEAVAPSLLAVLDDYYYNQKSFIVQGPVRYLEKCHSEEAIHVLSRSEIGIGIDGNISRLSEKNFSASILPVVQQRLADRPKWKKFDSLNGGHSIILIVGLCREFGALTTSEIRSHLKTFGVVDIRFENWVYCAQLLGWLKRVRNGNHIFFVATISDAPIDYNFRDGTLIKEKIRWRSDIREYWKENDRARFNAIGATAIGDAGV